MDRFRSSRNGKADPKTKKTLKQFKHEIEIKTPTNVRSEEMALKNCGYLGDHMVKKLVMLSEEQLIGRK